MIDFISIEISKAGIIHVGITPSGEKFIRSLLDEPKIVHPDVTGPACPYCGKKMTLGKGRNSPFWRCVDFPDCHGIRYIKPLEF